MCTELSTDSLHIPVRISKAERAAVQWNQGLSALNKRFERCFLRSGDGIMVGIDE